MLKCESNRKYAIGDGMILPLLTLMIECANVTEYLLKFWIKFIVSDIMNFLYSSVLLLLACIRWRKKHWKREATNWNIFAQN